ncbi:hypothetical protein M9H77_32731 [Catharanthus roseus]|uniref:Uncharacterized protein n=1 Tax=Catharanthus roseus TaxID=4058 RepID=A0ACC0A5R7_CATRO|nr:hypothetical protein M9H77_32731 [Catharanthus roseus]
MASNEQKRRQNMELVIDPVDRLAGNLDLTNEILKRLSFKSSIRCMTVCNNWYGLIQTINTLKSGKISGLFYHVPSLPLGRYQFIPLLDGEDDSAFTVNPYLQCQFEHSRILQSSNGVLLLYNSFPMRRYYVYNTANKEHSVLPELSSDYIMSISLAFTEPFQYKVIALLRLSGRPVQILIYSSGEGEMWRFVEDIVIEIIPGVKFLEGVCWNNSMIWVNFNPHMHSLMFDLDNETLLPIASPPIRYPYKKETISCKESQGRLYFIEFDCYYTLSKFHVYELEKDEMKWLLRYNVDLGDYIKESKLDWSRQNLPILLSLIHGDNKEETGLLLYTNCQVLSYKLKNKACVKVCDLNIDVEKYKYFRHWGHKCILYHEMPVHPLKSFSGETTENAATGVSHLSN